MRKARFEPAQMWMFDFRASVGNDVQLVGLCARSNASTTHDGNLYTFTQLSHSDRETVAEIPWSSTSHVVALNGLVV
jgi:hypothetical protein